MRYFRCLSGQMRQRALTDRKGRFCRNGRNRIIEMNSGQGSYESRDLVAALFVTFGHNVTRSGKERCMESMRDVNRVMEREIAKGSSPLKAGSY